MLRNLDIKKKPRFEGICNHLNGSKKIPWSINKSGWAHMVYKKDKVLRFKPWSNASNISSNISTHKNLKFSDVFEGVIKRIQHQIQHLKTKFVFDLDQTSSNMNLQICKIQHGWSNASNISSNIGFQHVGWNVGCVWPGLYKNRQFWNWQYVYESRPVRHFRTVIQDSTCSKTACKYHINEESFEMTHTLGNWRDTCQMDGLDKWKRVWSKVIIQSV